MLGPAMDGGGAIAAADDAADGDDGDIGQEVLTIACVPRIGERFEVRADGADVDELGHERHPGDRSVPGSARRSEAFGNPVMTTGSRVTSKAPSRQTTQAA